MSGSVLGLSADHSSFYVGYAFSGIVEKYSVAEGVLVCSTLAHRGDVHSLTAVQPDVICTSGSDGQVRLLDLDLNCSTAETSAPFRATSDATFSPDELAYNDMCSGVLSVRLTRPSDDVQTSSPYSVIVCSSGAPRLIALHHSLSVYSLGTTVPDNIGEHDTHYTLRSLMIMSTSFLHTFRI